jgi:hypothetical protein
MKFIELHGFSGTAPKLLGQGHIRYQLWADEDTNYELYVQIVDNERTGSFSDSSFRVADYAHTRNSDEPLTHLRGYNPQTGEKVEVRDNNNGGFLKAILRHLLRDEEN